MIKIVFFICSLFFLTPTINAQNYKLSSLDKKVELVVVNDSVLSYSLNYQGKKVIRFSSLGMTLNSGKHWGWG